MILTAALHCPEFPTTAPPRDGLIDLAGHLHVSQPQGIDSTAANEVLSRQLISFFPVKASAGRHSFSTQSADRHHDILSQAPAVELVCDLRLYPLSVLTLFH